MGQVVDMEQRSRRAERERDRDAVRSLHPAGRWVAGDTFYIAHRKALGGAACGAPGLLTLAPPGVPRCVDPECFPVTGR